MREIVVQFVAEKKGGDRLIKMELLIVSLEMDVRINT